MPEMLIIKTTIYRPR